MACFHPKSAYRTEEGAVKLALGETEKARATRFELPCRQCIGCRHDKAAEWTLRMVHEQREHERGAFVTLTYDNDHLPTLGDLDYSGVQRFLKRTRKAKGPFRYYVCGEYGPLTQRAHWHAAIFGIDFERGDPAGKSEVGTVCYGSPELNALWQQGFATVGDLTRESMGYVARYVTKKLTGDLGREVYTVVDQSTGEILGERRPPFARMSTRPAIGAAYCDKYANEIAQWGSIVSIGRPVPVPAYYERRLLRDPRFADAVDEYKASRAAFNAKRAADCTPERLAVREEVLRARVRNQKRGKH